MADLTFKRNDTWPKVKFALTQTNPSTGKPEAINLSTAIKVTLWLKSGATLIEGTPVTGPGGGALDASGECEYELDADDTAIAGTFEAEAEIEWSSSPLHVETVPNDSTRSVLILPDLANA